EASNEHCEPTASEHRRRAPARLRAQRVRRRAMSTGQMSTGRVGAGQQLALRSIDDYLGPGERRFFSRGYQRAEYDVYRIAVTADEQRHGHVTAEADVHYPSDWSSKKDSVDLR